MVVEGRGPSQRRHPQANKGEVVSTYDERLEEVFNISLLCVWVDLAKVDSRGSHCERWG